MSVSYNIYRMSYDKLTSLEDKITQEGLVAQKTILHKSYNLKFYFSEQLRGNEIWWWSVFSDFFKEGVEKPYNIFYFGLLVAFKEAEPENCYLVSLGKSHFYLNKFIEADFGLNVAMRIANDNNILLKKSRYFCGGKSQEASSYLEFTKGSYFPGESIENLKMKANDIDRWGNNNITFSDSIQLTLGEDPKALVNVFNDLDSSLITQGVIEFPKSEKIIDKSKIEELDQRLLASILNEDKEIIVDEIQSLGAAIIINNALTQFKLHTKLEGRNKYDRYSDKLNDITVKDIMDFFKSNDIKDISKVHVKITNEDSAGYTASLKEIISITYSEGRDNYFLKKGEWNTFNDVFMNYLAKSLDKIAFEIKEEVKEVDFEHWKESKSKEISQGTSRDKLTYREYWFNEKISMEKDYDLLDRKLTKIPSIRDEGRDYNIEIADLYKEGELIAVKISDKPHDLIYNIQQSITTIQTIKRGVVEFKQPLEYTVLWISSTKDINKLTDINSIQFLLAIQNWKEVVEGFNLKPKIYYSRHIIE